MSIKHIAVYKCDAQYCLVTSRIKSFQSTEYGYRDEQRLLEKRGWEFTGIEDGFKAYCKSCSKQRVK